MILFVLILNGCARVPIKNSEWCADAGIDGAYCFKTLSDDARILTKEEWDEIRFGQICGSPQTFANFKKALLKLCRISKACDYETVSTIQAFGRGAGIR